MRHINVRKTHGLATSFMYPIGVGSEPATQIRALDWESNLRPFGQRADALTPDQSHLGHVDLAFCVSSPLIKKQSLH